MNSVLEFSQLRELRENIKKKGQKIVFTNGCFDLLHVGHIRYLSEAKTLGSILIVAINSDSSVRQLKGPTRPVQNENDRAEILTALKSVDYAVVFSEPTPLRIIEELKPDVLVKGGDWPISQIVGSDFVLKNGGQVFSLQFVPGRSTSQIIEKSQKN